jgi:nucleoid DNA-binding protein
MSKKDLIEAVAAKTELTREKANSVVQAVIDHITEKMKAREDVRIPELGTFKVTERKARTGRNPATGAEIKIPQSTVPKFQPSKALKDAVAGR